MRALPVATYWVIRSGSMVVANASQAGHWKSDQVSTVTGASAFPSARGFVGSMSATGVGWSGLSRVPTVAFGLRTPDARMMTTSPITTAAAVVRAIGDCHAGRWVGTVRAEARRWSRRAASRRSCRVAGGRCVPVGRGVPGFFGGRSPVELEFVDMRTLVSGEGLTRGDAGAAYPVRRRVVLPGAVMTGRRGPASGARPEVERQDHDEIRAPGRERDD